MIRRCDETSDKDYPKYGGRGIRVCTQWYDFWTFVSDVGERPSELHQLDRYPDNDGGYEPGNVRWATLVENNNNKRNNANVQYKGEWYTVTQLAQKVNMSDGTLHSRIFRLGWSVERAVETPVRGIRRWDC